MFEVGDRETRHIRKILHGRHKTQKKEGHGGMVLFNGIASSRKHITSQSEAQWVSPSVILKIPAECFSRLIGLTMPNKIFKV